MNIKFKCNYKCKIYLSFCAYEVRTRAVKRDEYICHANEKSSTELTIECCHRTTARGQNHFIHLSLDDPSETQKEEFTFEIEQMKMLGSHKNVVSMVGCCTHEEKMFLVIEYVPCGDLLTWLRRRRKKVRKSRKSHCSVFSCSEGVDYHFFMTI